MTTYVEFSSTRKNLIASIKAIITDSENMRPPRDEYGYRAPKIFFRDYVLYAAVRGADWKKTSHLYLEGAPNAREELETLYKALVDNLNKGNAATTVPYRWARYIDLKADQVELRDLIGLALEV